jgi:hypothetical protein
VEVVPPGGSATAGAAGRFDVEVSSGTVARLVLGAFEPEPMLARSGVSPDVAEVLALLFPRRDGYIYPPDRF